jgi:hypothetical protein
LGRRIITNFEKETSTDNKIKALHPDLRHNSVYSGPQAFSTVLDWCVCSVLAKRAYHEMFRSFEIIPPRKSVLDCSKWGRFDGYEQQETMHSKTIKSHRLIQFLAICKANGVHTVWEACQRWPRLLTTTTVHRGITTSLFPEEMFEQNRRTVYEVQQREAAVSAMNLTFGLPDGIPAMIMAFAQDTRHSNPGPPSSPYLDHTR